MYGTKRIYAPSGGYQPRYYKKARYSTTSAVASRNRYTTKGPSKAGTLLQQVKSLQRVVKQLQPELKSADVSIDATNIDSTNGTVIHLSAIGQGDGQTNRTGNCITVRKIDVGFQVTRNAAYTGVTNPTLRWAIIVDKEQIADTSPVGLSVFEFPSLAIVDFPQSANLERFRFLYVSPVIDLHMIGFNDTTTPVVNRANAFNHHWSGDIKVGYNGSATTDIEKNGIYIVYISQGTASELDVTGYSRIQFTDV